MSRTIVSFLFRSVVARRLRTSALILGLLLPSSLLALPAAAVQLRGQTFFDYSPRLLKATTSVMTTRTWGATYYFTLNVPQNAGEPLQAIKIVPRRNADTVEFQPSESLAFACTRYARGPALSLASIGGFEPSDTEEMTVVFDPPVQPGSIVTVALKPRRNPDLGGVYLFGVTAFPLGESSSGQFLGYGRFTFYDNGR